MRTRFAILAAAFVVSLTGVAVAADDDDPSDCGFPQGGDRVTLDPSEFTTTIDNPYWPMKPGATWTFVERDGEGGEETITITVTNETKTIAGVRARVVRDTARDEDGHLVEDTFDWFAQHEDGTIWYLGEDTKEYEDGEVVSTEGSWEHGVDGALAGVIMPGDPEPGCTYRQEYAKGEAEDNGMILATNEIVRLPVGSFRDVVTTQDTSAIERWTLEHKLYARGIGPILALQVSDGASREVLVATGH